MDPKKLAAAAVAAASVGTETDKQQAIVNFLDPVEMAQSVFMDGAERARRETTEEYTQQAVQAQHERVAQQNYEAAVADRRRRIEARKDKARMKTEKARAKRKKAKKAKKKGQR